MLQVMLTETLKVFNKMAPKILYDILKVRATPYSMHNQKVLKYAEYVTFTMALGI